MHHRLLHQSAVLTLDYDSVDDYLHAIWAPEQDLDTTRAGYEQMLAQLQTVHCHRLLDDRRQACLMWDELADWLATDWYPRARRAGLTAHVVVFSADFYGHRATEVVMAGAGLMRGFSSEEAARRALLTT
ncbi:hypothetical protein GCM10022408_16350 [Hymenobacter fastidiosus]|uniref:Uncharacterized protein n=1 Tax=Hymenobacter fastidiosus TaxID=486264 RepID=A0ABP7S1R1_9BACT